MSDLGPFDATFSSARIDKPWGHEEIWALSESYCGKRITVEAGHALSLQFHRHKHETMFCIEGSGFVDIGPDEESLLTVALQPGVGVVIAVGDVHRLRASKDEPVVVLEASTGELDDVVRLADDYGRADPAA